ncbi:MAG: hypothetical protein AABX10_01310 [Nanoarchaeota archaeon]
MNKIIISSVITVFLLASITSAALGIGFTGEVNQEKNTQEEHTLTLFTFGDKSDRAVLTVKQGQECISFPDGVNVDFDDKDTAYKTVIVKTTKSCDNAEVKIQLSPVVSTTGSGTVGMNLAVVKSFIIKSVAPSINTVAIVAITALILAVLILVAAMVKIAKRRN